jgi:hypothetical protein
MWKKLALVAAVLTASPEVFPVRAASEPKPLPDARLAEPVGAAEPAGETFAAICRADEVVDSRRDPAWLGQSYVGDNCQAPQMPGAIDGYKASQEQIVAGMAAVKRYAAAADSFQKCVSDFVAARKTGSGRPLTPSQVIIQNYRVLVSQKSKETAEGQMRVAIVAFNKYGSDCPM